VVEVVQNLFQPVVHSYLVILMKAYKVDLLLNSHLMEVF
jgi:hypothetical protein